MEVIGGVPEDRWRIVPEPGVWSISKDAAHIADAATYHQWIVRLTIGEKVPSSRPPIERAQLTSDLSATDAMELIRRRTDAGIGLIQTLTDAQLQLPTRPLRARGQLLVTTIERVLIGHYDIHRAAIEAKLALLRKR
jgi:uncharacterized damage-inducible protein DinB